MHRICLKQYSRPNKLRTFKREKYFRVFVNDKTFYFTSERATLAFLAEINRHLNALAMDLNVLVADVYVEYRYYFFHLSTMQRNLFEVQFNGINRLFDLLMERSDTANGNSFTYDRFNKIIGMLNDMATVIEDHPLNASSTVQRYRLRNLNARIQMAAERLQWHPEYRKPSDIR